MVLIGEPPRTQGDVHFVLLGIPVRIHPLFWFVTLLLAARPDTTLPEMLIWLVAVFISILIHELGHAATARAFGWKSYIVLFWFGGLAPYTASYDDPKRNVLITLAGPGAGFLFAGLLLLVMAAMGSPVQFAVGGPWGLEWRISGIANFNLYLLIHYLLFINIFWGLINLAPVYPLDGGRIAREVLATLSGQRGIIQSMWLSVIAGAALAALSVIQFGARDGFFTALMFGAFAYSSYTALKAYSPGTWRDGSESAPEDRW